MTRPILALILPVGDSGGGYPDNTLPSPPLYPSQGPGFPTHPIAPGGQPPLYPSQGPGFPTHPIAPGGGGQPPYPSTGPGFPTHPIAPGGQPPYPSQGPGFPTHPIAPGGGGGGGGGGGYPSQLPNMILAYVPGYGWCWLQVPSPDGGSGNRPDNSLPGNQPGIDNTLPGGSGGRPDNTLPGNQPTPKPGQK